MNEHLHNKTDEELRQYITDIEAILDQRDRKRKQKAMAQIRSIAKEHGLKVGAKQRKTRKRRKSGQKEDGT